MRLFNRIGLCFAFSFVAADSYVWAANFNPLPDTGQDKCYNNTGDEIACPSEGQALYGQDAQFYGPVPSYTSYTINGDVIVRDNNTNLIWQQNTADVNGDGSITSENYPTGDQMTWQEAMDYCASLVFAGFTDWHLPTCNELESIIEYHTTSIAVRINSTFQGKRDYYWSATVYCVGNDGAWYVDFNLGYQGYSARSDYNYVRCVREGS